MRKIPKYPMLAHLDIIESRLGFEVIKHFSGSTWLSMKIILLVNVEMPTTSEIESNKTHNYSAL